jgi:hypothetical protein
MSNSWFRRLGKRLFGDNGPRQASRKPRSVRLSVESLEDRLALSSATPAAITWGNQLHVFQTDRYGHLEDHYTVGNSNSQWVDLGRPAGSDPGWRMDGKTAAPVVYGASLHVFIITANGQLFDYCWNGQGQPSSGTWLDRTLDSGSPGGFSGTPSVISYGGSLHVFAQSCGNVWDDMLTGYSWQWHNHGNGGAPVDSNPATIVYYGVLHVYVTAADGNLYDHWWSGQTFQSQSLSAGFTASVAASPWHFDNHGNGGSSLASHTASAITYNNDLHVFVTGQDGNLYDHWWDGGGWHFDNRGQGGSGGFRYATPAAIVYNGTLHVYLRGWDLNLYDYHTDGTQSYLDNHGAGNTFDSWRWGGARVESDPAVVVFNGNLHVFVAEDMGVVENGVWGHDLWDHWWNGGWNWDDNGSV